MSEYELDYNHIVHYLNLRLFTIYNYYTGALDLTEEIGAAIGIPHVPEIWEEIQRSHSRHGRDTPQTTLHPNNGERVGM